MILSFTLLICYSAAGQVFKTEALSGDIHTIQVNASGDWQKLPIVEMNRNEFVRINFDRLGEDSYAYLRYKVIHCNADWTPSRLSDIEYLDGFNNVLIEDYSNSFGTNVLYNNFNIEIPNDRLKLKLSGNYAVEVFEEDNPSEILLRACFSVLDPQVMLGGSISSVTDIDANKAHQQVSFYVNYNNLQVRDVFSDLKVYVRQNNRLDNQKVNIKPTSVQGNKLVYEHNRDLIFDAGNEYRRFETVSHRYNGLNVESTRYEGSMYYAKIYTDKIRAGKTYSYDEDRNGRFFIRNAEANCSETEADYFVTQFTLASPTPFIEPVYLNGGFTNNKFDDKYLMTYDHDKKEYSLSLLLKQGAYNYQYLARTGNNFTTALTEGNYYETENEYDILVYYSPLGSRSDLLVGMLLIGGK